MWLDVEMLVRPRGDVDRARDGDAAGRKKRRAIALPVRAGGGEQQPGEQQRGSAPESRAVASAGSGS